MTLVVGATSKKSIWLMTDRRIIYGSRKPKDDARKVFFLESTDGLALLGYAGLAATAMGMEPSDWMGRVLRGRKLPLEQSLSVLAGAVQARLPRHLDSLAGVGAPAHNIIVSAFHNGEPKIYTIDLVRTPGRNEYAFRFTRHVVHRQVPGGYMTPRCIIGGSGAVHLLRDKRWMRDILRLIKAHDAGRITPTPVAAALANLNHRVAGVEPTVGRRCIVAWRFRKGGGAHEFFDGGQREISSSFVRLPINAHGMDVTSLLKVMAPFTIARLDALRRGEAIEMDTEAINTELAKLPDTPDDKLA